jgi:DNA-binding HxlR family transcriptional regulator
MYNVKSVRGGVVNDARFLAGLFHHRWAVPVLAALSAGAGGRVIELTHRLGASRGGMRQALGSLVDLGLAARNPGHGHPLRPEYLLTARGERVAADAERIVELVHGWSIESVAYRKWPLPVVYGLSDGARFSELRARLPGITDRALADALRALGTSRLTERVVHPGHPPGVEYLPTARAGELLLPLRRLARAA